MTIGSREATEEIFNMLKKFAIVFCLVALSVPIAASAQSTLSVGQRVKTTANVNVRSKPTNAKKNALCIQTTGSVGTIVGGPTVATGYTWWNVNYDTGCDGWSVQNYLTTSLAYDPQSQVASQALPSKTSTRSS